MVTCSNRIIGGLAAIVLVAAITPRLYAEPINETKAATATGSVHIENVSGSVVVKGWDRNEISVEGTLGRGAERLEFEVVGSRATIEVINPRRARNVEETDLTIHVPAGSELEVSTVSAFIEIAGVTGATEAKSVSGEVTVEGEMARLSAASVSGSLTLDVTTEEMDAETVSGSIEIGGRCANIEGSSVSGSIDIEVDGTNAERVSLETVSGSLSFEGALARSGHFEFESHSGSIELRLDSDVDANFEITTYSGSITNDFGEAPKRKSRYAPGEELEFTLGEGSAQVSVTSFSGAIELLSAADAK
jgi:DUF4097 and DUF4098 domain-containing protein YvlB